jgi:hypothetical protein
MKVDIFIWSKDRPMQLDSCLRSIYDNFENAGKVYVLYDFSNQSYLSGYKKIFKKNYNLKIEFLKQDPTIFKVENEKVLDKIETEYSLGLCDDSLFIKKINVNEVISFSNDNDDISCISLRLGKNIKKNYVTKNIDDFPNFIKNDKYLVWNWKDAENAWSYPFAVETHLFKHSWYKNFVKNLDYHIPTTLEAAFVTNKDKFKPIMISFFESKVSNICTNRVQNYSQNLFDKKRNFTAEYLNNLFLNNLIIDNEKIYNNISEYLFQEIDIEFKNDS